MYINTTNTRQVPVEQKTQHVFCSDSLRSVTSKVRYGAGTLRLTRLTYLGQGARGWFGLIVIKGSTGFGNMSVSSGIHDRVIMLRGGEKEARQQGS